MKKSASFRLPFSVTQKPPVQKKERKKERKRKERKKEREMNGKKER
jgi:hypothetical protein